ncbi:hypothetical protein FSHL1_009802 [Fusarium sambucinum]
MAETLCAPCSGFVQSIGEVEDADWSSSLKVAPNIHSLRSQARNGCSLCQIIYQSCFYFGTISWEHQDYPITISASPLRFIDPYDVQYHEYCKMVRDMEKRDELPFRNLYPRDIQLYINVGENGNGRTHFLPVVGNHDAQKEDPQYAILDPSTPHGLQRTIQLAKEWLLVCRSGHIGCGNSASNRTNVLPTRLIDVGETMPRLHIPDHDTRDIEYAALSYAWGIDHANFAKTTASNLNDMRTLLPWDRLSKTIQDAIVITRGLGLKYLWVDALCVLQKEKINDVQHMEDWSTEAVRFASYYQNAVLTIAATGSESSSRGLFLERPGLEFSPEPVVIRQKSYWTGFKESTIQPLRPKPGSETVHSALLTRGWTTQERLLSERILHFGANCIFWECSGGYTSEIHPDHFVSAHDDFFMFKNIKTFNTEQLTEMWYYFVSEYSMKEFSIGSDRLPALSGVATLISDTCQQKYLAGIWESSIAEGLTWMAVSTYDIHTDDSVIDKLSQNSERVLPSWSWASNNGLVDLLFQRSPWESMIQVENFHSRSKGSETSGQIIEARLTLKGLFRMVDLSQLNLRYPHNKHTTEGSNHQDTHKYEHDVRLDGPKPTNPISTHPRLCLLIGTIYDVESGLNPWHKVKMGVACVLEHCGRCYGEFEEYKRIGIVSLPYDQYWSKVKDVRTIELV